MFITEAKIGNQWTALNDLCQVDDDEEYIIVNNSLYTIYAVEGDAMPAETITGNPVPTAGHICYIKAGQNLYLRNGQNKLTKDGVVVNDRPALVTINKVG